MKIRKYYENIYDRVTDIIPSNNYSKKLNDYLVDFDNSVDSTIIRWIDTVAWETKLKEYTNLENNNNLLLLANNKKLTSLKKYAEIDKEIESNEKKIIKLKNIQKKLYTSISNDILYKFQEDLIQYDFNNFYKLFIEDGTDINNCDIHPDILLKYYDEIKLKMKTNKYNL